MVGIEMSPDVVIHYISYLGHAADTEEGNGKVCLV